MSKESGNLGKLISTHGVSPVLLQRAAIVTLLSFVFFLSMLVAFYIRQHIGYFVISTAFLVVYLFTLIGWMLQRRNVLKLFQNGFAYRAFQGKWNEIEIVTINVPGALTSGANIRKQNGETVNIPVSLQGFDEIVETIKRNVALNF